MTVVALRVPADDLAGVMMGEAPLFVLADEQVARRHRTAVQLLLAEHQRDIAVEEHLLVKAGDARRVGIREDPLPALDDRVALLQRGPPRMETGDRGPAGP